jgi:hypothetical protein
MLGDRCHVSPSINHQPKIRGNPNMLATNEEYKPRWSKAKPGSWKAISESSEALAAENKIHEFLSNLPPTTALAAAAWSAYEAGRRYYESKPPRGTLVAYIRDHQCQLITRMTERFPTPSDVVVRRILSIVDDLPTDLSFAATVLALHELSAKYHREAMQ